MPSLLLELLTEEIPARMQARALADLQRLFTEQLQARALPFTALEGHVTPRRLMLRISGLPVRQPDLAEEKRGPRKDSPAAALEGFVKATGMPLSACEQRETPKGVFYFATIRQPGQATAVVLPHIIGDVLLNFPWPKSMRWGGGAFRWVRPLQGILALVDGVPLQGGFALGSATDPQAPLGYVDNIYQGHTPVIPFTNTTTGHRIHGADVLQIADTGDYEEKLRQASVILSAEARKAIIQTRGAELAAALGLTVEFHAGLLEEVAGLVEWPVPLLGRIDDKYMVIPQEVLVTSMRTHQKYFALRNAQGALAPYFLTVANQETADGGKAVIAGNERVLRARLSDAAYFFEKDSKTALADFNTRLQNVVFHARLGSIADKAVRVGDLAGYLGRWLFPDHTGIATTCERAGSLAKADLATGMVGEFPELQGIMGGHYAAAAGENPAVCDAIRTHYQPQGPSQPVPTAPVSIAVALADKLDTLFWFFAISETPTGSRDPYALRRAGLGIIRLLLENACVTRTQHLHLSAVFEKIFAIGNTRQMLWQAAGLAADADRGALFSALKAFLRERFEHHLESQGHRRDIIRAVLNADVFEDVSSAFAKVQQTEAFLATPEAEALLVAYRRASNILAIEEKKDKTIYTGTVMPQLLGDAAEQALDAALSGQAAWLQSQQENANFATILARIADLRPAIDAFFATVTVNAENADVRRNRLNLLARIRATVNQVADLAQVEE
jgi:glycyl-tRNA synthetase beta chain